jgi:hypothetical protein
VGILGALNGPVATFAWVGAIAIGLGWTFSSMLTKGSTSQQ